MTKEEAARILDPETSAGALEGYGGEHQQLIAGVEALQIAVEALRNPVKMDHGKLKINKDAWKPCRVCKGKTCSTCRFFGTPDHVPPCFMCWNNQEPEHYKAANFCQECGRPLTLYAVEVLENKLNGGKSSE